MFPTSYLGSLGFVNIEPIILKQVQNLDNKTSKLLKESTKYGETRIVTNAAIGWVEHSSLR